MTGVPLICRTSSILLLCLTTGLVACDTSDPAPERTPWAWAESLDSVGFRAIAEAPTTCQDCLVFTLVNILGDQDGPGLLLNNGQVDDVVVDHQGNFWVGQDGLVKVFDAAGDFLRDVGRRGQGPLEFRLPMPIHTDSRGNVHIFDSGNSRETVVTPDFELQGDRQLPGFVNKAVPLADGDRYAVNMSALTADGIGQPLHIIRGPEVLHSFGLMAENNVAVPLDSLHSSRILAIDSMGHIISASPYEYVIEAWGQSGQRIAGFNGPRLNRKEPRPGPFSEDNPMANRITGIRVDKSGLLWVLSWRAAADWREHMVEQIAPDGRIMLMPTDGIRPLFRGTQVDVIDLNTGLIIETSHVTDLLMTFLGDGLVAAVRLDALDNLQLAIWSISRQSEGGERTSHAEQPQEQ